LTFKTRISVYEQNSFEEQKSSAPLQPSGQLAPHGQKLIQSKWDAWHRVSHLIFSQKSLTHKTHV
jgi:hypothetical protein